MFVAAFVWLGGAHPASAEGALLEEARAAFEAAREKTLREPLDGRIDAVWHVDLLLSIRPDPQLRFWADARRRLQADHPTYRLIEPTAELTELPEDPGSGLDKWSVYMKAPFGTPRERAARYVAEYLGPPLAAPESGYVLTHQLTVLEWARMTDLPLPDGLYERKPVLLARIAEEHAADDTFSDLFAERICFLALYGNPSDEELARSVRIIVDAQVEPGVWAPPPVTLTYDGQSRDTEVEPEHARKMSMVALAEFLRRNEGTAPDDGGTDTADGGTDTADGGTAPDDGGPDTDPDPDTGLVWWIAGALLLLGGLLFVVRRVRS